jgi:hypothetical protein
MKKLSIAEKQKRQEYLTRLRTGAIDKPDPMGYLTKLASEGDDQSVQKSALTGLSNHANDPRAVLGFAMRLLDPWGITTIGHVIQILTKLRDQGGLVVLSSTLFWDDRFIYDKVMAIKKVLQKEGDEQDQLKIEELEKVGNYFVEPGLVNEWMKVVLETNDPDVREGAIFGSEFEGMVGSPSRALAKRSLDEVSHAEKYVNSRIPGLVDLYNKKMVRKTYT